MSTFAAELDRVEPGLVEIVVPFGAGLTQQDGFLHAGVVIAAMDSACGYAALTLMEPDFPRVSQFIDRRLPMPAGLALFPLVWGRGVDLGEIAWR